MAAVPKSLHCFLEWENKFFGHRHSHPLMHRGKEFLGKMHLLTEKFAIAFDTLAFLI